jgi:uncharacterized protein
LGLHIWAIADLHLSFSLPNKKMDVFGTQWKNHPQKIKAQWEKKISPEDLILIPGDISWAMNSEEVQADLDWIHQLPGTKLLLKGNHDYWWSSFKKVQALLPPSIHCIQNNSFQWNNIAIGGSRLWDSSEYNFNKWVEFKKNLQISSSSIKTTEQDEKIFTRELHRLELSLKELSQKAHYRIAMTHYPPIGPTLQNSKASMLLEKYSINSCVFGHLHSLKTNLPALFGKHNAIDYHLTACDYLDFNPKLILSVDEVTRPRL